MHMTCSFCKYILVTEVECFNLPVKFDDQVLDTSSAYGFMASATTSGGLHLKVCIKFQKRNWHEPKLHMKCS